jgi:hypothetical protein
MSQTPFRICLIVILLFPAFASAQGFLTYMQERSFLKLMLDCPKENILPAMKGFGSLYICTLGNKNTIKLYVSEDPDSGGVLNVGLLWSDWKIDIGHGLHSDLGEAKKALTLLIDMYVPDKKNEIEDAFWMLKNEDFSTSEFAVYLTPKESLQKDERLLVIEEK